MLQYLTRRDPYKTQPQLDILVDKGEVVLIFWVISSSFCGGSDLFLRVTDLEDPSGECEVGGRGLRVSITDLGKYICHRRQPQ